MQKKIRLPIVGIFINWYEVKTIKIKKGMKLRSPMNMSDTMRRK